MKGDTNSIYSSPVLTCWPDSFSKRNLKECFQIKKKGKNKTGDKKQNPVSAFFANLFV